MHLISESKCPYCDTRLDPTPKKKRNCPSCGKVILVRTRPSDRQRVLVTEEEAKKIEEEWSKDQRIERYKRKLESYGIDEREYSKIERELTKKWGRATSAGDVIWAAFNKVLQEAMKRSDWQQMKVIYYGQARFLYEEGEEFFFIRQEAAKSELRSYQESGVKKVEILAAPDSCDKCKALESKQMSIEQALKSLPIPVKDCANGFCRCLYEVVF